MLRKNEMHKEAPMLNTSSPCPFVWANASEKHGPFVYLIRTDYYIIQKGQNLHRFCFNYSPIEIGFHLGNPLNKDLH